jgi:proteasome lid subunit RPN8/RPN11
MRLIMSREHFDQIEGNAKVRAPVEACGILVGRQRGNDFEVLDVVEASNVMNSPMRFEIDPEEIYQVIKDAEARGLEVIGFYHSHLCYGAAPSAVDKERMKFLSNLVCLICDISAKNVEFRAFVLRAGKLTEMEPVVT